MDNKYPNPGPVNHPPPPVQAPLSARCRKCKRGFHYYGAQTQKIRCEACGTVNEVPTRRSFLPQSVGEKIAVVILIPFCLWVVGVPLSVIAVCGQNVDVAAEQAKRPPTEPITPEETRAAALIRLAEEAAQEKLQLERAQTLAKQAVAQRVDQRAQMEAFYEKTITIDDAAVRERCSVDWEDQPSMMRHCIRQQTQNARKIHRQIEKHKDDAAFFEIYRRCASEYEDSYGYQMDMTHHCVGQEVEGLRFIRKKYDRHPKLRSCRAQWTHQPSMIKYCIEGG